MTLNTRDRSVLFESLSKLADPEAVDAMLAHFPTRDVDEPLTRDYLDSRLIEFREEVRLAILTEFRAFDAKLASLDARLTSEIGSLRQYMEAQFRRSLQWTVATMIALATVITAVMMILR